MERGWDADPLASPKGTLNSARLSEILDAAEEAFSEKGYDGTTLEDIASRVGLLKGSLYYYVTSKADLFFRVSERSLRQHLRALEEDPGVATGDALSRLLCFIDRNMSQLLHTWKWRGVFDGYLMSRLTPSAVTVINAMRHQIFLLLQDILTQGISEGRFDSGTDPSVAAHTILSVMNRTNTWFDSDGRQSYDQIVDWYKTLILRGLDATPQLSLP